MAPLTGRKSLSMEVAAAEVARGAWEGTADLVEAVAAESRYAHGWRPLRAALVRAVADLESGGGQVWDGARFTAWEAEAKLIAKARGDGKLSERLGLSPLQWRKARKDGLDKARALACLHYSLGLPMPIPAEDTRAFDEWYRPRFGGVDRVADWLGVSKDWLGDRLRGYELVGAKRSDRLPPAWLIRALDWLFTVGPITPFETPFAPYWPGQSLEEDY